MAKERNALKAGTFMAVSLILAVGVIIAISGTDALFQPKQVRKVTFTLHEDIGGLQPGDPVRIGGYMVGKVHSIEVVQGKAGEAGGGQMHTEIMISLPRKYVIREDAVVAINGTMIGASWLNFETLGQGKPLGANEELVGRVEGINAAMQEMSEIMPRLKETITLVNEKTLPAVNTDLAKFGGTADSLTQIAGSGNELVTHLNGSIDPLVKKVSAVASDASGALQEIKGVAQHADTQIIPNVAAMTGSLKDKLPGILDQTSTLLSQGTKSMQDASAALAEAKATFSNTHMMMGTANDVITGNKSKLGDIISSLKATSDNLKNASVEIRHSPWRLIYKPGADEMGNLNIYDAARQFSDGAGALKESAEALRDASKNKDMTAEQLKPLIEKLQGSFDKFHATESGLWNAVK